MHTSIPPRDRMVEAALQGLRASGLAGAGINQVIAASGAPKGSLYHYFPGGKLQLVGEALQLFGEQRRAELATVAAGDGGPADKVRRLFRRAARGMAAEDYRYGCALAGVALDLEADSEPLRPLLAAELDTWAALIADILQPLEQRKPLARLVLSCYEGALVQARALRSGQPLLEAGDQLARSIAHLS